MPSPGMGLVWLWIKCGCVCAGRHVHIHTSWVARAVVRAWMGRWEIVSWDQAGVADAEQGALAPEKREHFVMMGCPLHAGGDKSSQIGRAGGRHSVESAYESHGGCSILKGRWAAATWCNTTRSDKVRSDLNRDPWGRVVRGGQEGDGTGDRRSIHGSGITGLVVTWLSPFHCSV